MNRLSFLKSLIAAPLAPLALNSQEQFKEESGQVLESKLENCIPQWPYKHKLLSYQQEIWEDYNRFERNLFIMSRGAGKTFMASMIASLKFGPEVGSLLKTNKKTNYLLRLKESIIDELTEHSENHFLMAKNWSGWKTTVFTGVTEENRNLLKELSIDKRWNVKIFNCENAGDIVYSKKFLTSIKEVSSKTSFDRDFLCKLS